MSIGSTWYATVETERGPELGSEGTFPYSWDLVAGMFEQVPHFADGDKAAVLGLNAAKMFGIDLGTVHEETARALSARASRAYAPRIYKLP